MSSGGLPLRVDLSVTISNKKHSFHRLSVSNIPHRVTKVYNSYVLVVCMWIYDWEFGRFSPRGDVSGIVCTCFSDSVVDLSADMREQHCQVSYKTSGVLFEHLMWIRCIAIVMDRSNSSG